VNATDERVRQCTFHFTEMQIHFTATVDDTIDRW
jgi:hypothetical protein